MKTQNLIDPYEITTEEAKEFLINHWGCKFDTSDSVTNYFDLWVYSEHTADDYEIYVATSNADGKIYVCEEVCYYKEGLNDPIYDTISNGGTVRIDLDLLDDLEYSLDWEDWYKDIFDELIED